LRRGKETQKQAQDLSRRNWYKTPVKTPPQQQQKRKISLKSLKQKQRRLSCCNSSFVEQTNEINVLIGC